METVCIKAKIKNGSLEKVREWFQTLKDRAPEVIQSLENEDIYVESAFLDKCGEDYYIIYYMKAKNLEHAREVAAKSTLDIDKYHKECRKTFCEEKQELELLMDFQRL